MTFNSRLTVEEYNRIRTILEEMIDGYQEPEEKGLGMIYMSGHKAGYLEALKAAIHLIRSES